MAARNNSPQIYNGADGMQITKINTAQRANAAFSTCSKLNIALNFSTIHTVVAINTGTFNQA